nr:hypothetical protein CFP56_38921 [Quercus suber]
MISPPSVHDNDTDRKLCERNLSTTARASPKRFSHQTRGRAPAHLLRANRILDSGRAAVHVQFLGRNTCRSSFLPMNMHGPAEEMFTIRRTCIRTSLRTIIFDISPSSPSLPRLLVFILSFHTLERALEWEEHRTPRRWEAFWRTIINMAHTSVSSCVLAIIASFSGGLDVLKKARARRSQTKRSNVAEVSNEEMQLIKSLQQGPSEIGRQYRKSVQAAGDQVAVGDGTVSFPESECRPQH